jgi:hypothetical protein
MERAVIAHPVLHPSEKPFRQWPACPIVVHEYRGRVVLDDGSERQVRARELGLDKHDDFVLALRILTRNGPGFAVQGAMGSGLGSRLPTVQKLRSAARDANNQFKNASRYRDLPCLLIIFQDDLFVAEDVTFLSAFYGDHQITWSLNDAEQSSEGFGPNGVWSETQNRTTSAACYVRNRAGELIPVDRTGTRHRRSITPCARHAAVQDNPSVARVERYPHMAPIVRISRDQHDLVSRRPIVVRGACKHPVNNGQRRLEVPIGRIV